MFSRLKIAVLAFSLAACGEWKVDSDSLTARTATPPQGMSCSGCHAYPLADFNHDYHLNRAPTKQKLNGVVTCLDCHSKSVRSEPVVVLDTVYEDTATTEKFHTLNFPGANAKNDSGIIIRSLTLNSIDTLPQNHPVPMPNRPGAVPAFQEYVTAAAHMNGSIDVVFDPRNSQPGKFGGDTASYNPKQETCSAVACHPADPKAYSWGSKAKGLPEIKEPKPE